MVVEQQGGELPLTPILTLILTSPSFLTLTLILASHTCFMSVSGKIPNSKTIAVMR